MGKATVGVKPFSVWLLVGLQAFLGIGAIAGGLGLMIDPQGEMIGMPIRFLDNSPFTNYFIPGLILCLVLGVIPAILSYSLARQKKWNLGEKLNIFKELHWSWSFSLYVGFALIIWITVQVYIIQAVGSVHLIYIALGLCIQAVTVLPSVRNHFLK
ncbi:MAG: hypothetical protein K6T85_02145 [Gorillibacterium sp.]|nr:hypothetical protein [Gorillibacterium sp.]